MKYIINILFIWVSSLSYLFSAAQAQGTGLVSDLSVYEVVNDTISAELDDSKMVQVGDTLEYRLIYTNNLQKGISSLKPILPIPIGMKYLAGTAEPVANAVSLDTVGQAFREPPLQQEITLLGGEKRMQKAMPDSYRRLQWHIESLSSGETVQFLIRVEVINSSMSASDS